MFYNKIPGSIKKFFLKHRENRYFQKFLFEEEYRFSLGTTRLFSSRGIVENCMIHPNVPRSSFVDENYVRSIPKRCEQISTERSLVTIYLCTDSIPMFVDEILDKIKRPFVLVSGDSDLSVSNQTIENIDKLIANDHMIKWFAQNLEYEHLKIESLPIGLDFHSAWQNPRHYGAKYILPSLQEGQLRAISRNGNKFSQRKPLVVCDWIGRSTYGDREEARCGISLDARFVPTRRLPRHELWLEYTKYAFVGSPAGIGLDCHRTWEAIALGCVPIIKKSTISPMFEGMPILIVESWSQVTVEYLSRAQKDFAAKRFDYSQIFMNFWLQRLFNNGCKEKLMSSIDDIAFVV